MALYNQMPSTCQKCGKPLNLDMPYCIYCHSVTNPKTLQIGDVELCPSTPFPSFPLEESEIPSQKLSNDELPKNLEAGDKRALILSSVTPLDKTQYVVEPEKVKGTALPKKKHRIRIFFFYFTIFFMVGTGSLWILSLLGIIANFWATISAVIFVVLGALFSFFQWVLPLVTDPREKTPSAFS